jgi:tetratricopeptide (TPR) repeat protein
MKAQEFVDRGQELSLQAEYDRAIEAYSEALRLAPAHAVAWYGRGYCHAARGDHGQALSDFAEGIRLDAGPLAQYALYISQAFCARAEDHLERRDFERALADFTEGIRLRPTTDAYRGKVWYRRGICHLARGDHAAAVADFDAALATGYTGHQDCVVHARALAERLRDREPPAGG